MCEDAITDKNLSHSNNTVHRKDSIKRSSKHQLAKQASLKCYLTSVLCYLRFFGNIFSMRAKVDDLRNL